VGGFLPTDPWMPPVVSAPPDVLTPSCIANAVTRAVAFRRALHRDDPRSSHYTAAALIEQVVGVTMRPMEAARGAVHGWYPVGEIHDGIAGAELRVWFQPTTGRIKTERLAATRPTSPPSAGCSDGRYFSGERELPNSGRFSATAHPRVLRNTENLGERPPMSREVVIAGEAWRVEELAGVIAAARTLARGIILERVDGREIAAPTRPHLWALLEALDAPSDRGEELDPALHDVAAA